MTVLTMDKKSLVKESMREPWRFCQVPKMAQHTQEKRKRHANSWFLVALVSSLLLLLLVKTAPFLARPTAENRHVFRLDNVDNNSIESCSKCTESRSIPEYTQPVVPFPFLAFVQTMTDTGLPQNWTHGIVKRVVIEICSLALLQSLGIPFAKFLYSSRWWSKGGLRFLASPSRHHKLVRQAHRSLLQHRSKSPHVLFQRVLQSIKRLYKRRSRLSAASDITHVIGDDADKDQKCNQQGA